MLELIKALLGFVPALPVDVDSKLGDEFGDGHRVTVWLCEEVIICVA
jgi:hypothetical protein